jgi:hypothetical protein
MLPLGWYYHCLGVILVVLSCWGFFATSHLEQYVFDDQAGFDQHPLLQDGSRGVSDLLWDSRLWKMDFWGNDMDSVASHKSFRPITTLYLYWIRHTMCPSLYPEPRDLPRCAHTLVGYTHIVAAIVTYCCVYHLAVASLMPYPKAKANTERKASGQKASPQISCQCLAVAVASLHSHPAKVESVAALVGAADILSFIACGLSLYLGAIAVLHPAVTQCRWKWNWKFCILQLLTLGTSVVAVLCKEVGIVCPLVIAPLQWLVWAGVRGQQPDSGRMLSWKTVSLTQGLILGLPWYCLVTWRVSLHGVPWRLPNITHGDNPLAFELPLFTGALPWPLSWVEDLPIINRVINLVSPYAYFLRHVLPIYAEYAKLLFFPVRTCADYSFREIEPILQPLGLWLVGGGVICVLALWWFASSLYTFIRLTIISSSSIKKDRAAAAAAACIHVSWILPLFAAVMFFLPASHLLTPVGTVVAERLLYIPATLVYGAICVVIFTWYHGIMAKFDQPLLLKDDHVDGWAKDHYHHPDHSKQLEMELEKEKQRKQPKQPKQQKLKLQWCFFTVCTLLLVIYVLVAGSVIDQRVHLWQTSLQLFANNVKACPKSARGWLNYGVALRDTHGDLQAQKNAFLHVVELDPSYFKGLYLLGVWHQQLDHAPPPTTTPQTRRKEMQRGLSYLQRLDRLFKQRLPAVSLPTSLPLLTLKQICTTCTALHHQHQNQNQNQNQNHPWLQPSCMEACLEVMLGDSSPSTCLAGGKLASQYPSLSRPPAHQRGVGIPMTETPQHLWTRLQRNNAQQHHLVQWVEGEGRGASRPIPPPLRALFVLAHATVAAEREKATAHANTNNNNSNNHTNPIPTMLSPCIIACAGFNATCLGLEALERAVNARDWEVIPDALRHLGAIVDNHGKVAEYAGRISRYLWPGRILSSHVRDVLGTGPHRMVNQRSLLTAIDVAVIEGICRSGADIADCDGARELLQPVTALEIRQILGIQDPSHASLLLSLTMQSHVALGDCYHRRGLQKEALGYYQQAIPFLQRLGGNTNLHRRVMSHVQALRGH